MYTTIIFDFFDVIRSDPYKAWLGERGIERVGEYAEASKPLDRGEITVGEFHDRLQELSGHDRATVAHHYDNTVLIDEGMPAFIAQLKQRFKTGLLSNASSDYLRPLLDEYGYHELFDEIVISGETGLIKPSTEAFEHILAQLGSQPEETIFVDDSPTNVAAANQLGITGVLFTNLSQLRTDLQRLGVAES